LGIRAIGKYRISSLQEGSENQLSIIRALESEFNGKKKRMSRLFA
jgi:hypothetical protein